MKEGNWRKEGPGAGSGTHLEFQHAEGSQFKAILGYTASSGPVRNGLTKTKAQTKTTQKAMLPLRRPGETGSVWRVDGHRAASCGHLSPVLTYGGADLQL